MSKYILSVDAETDGLYGEVFAVGAAVLTERNEIIDKLAIRTSLEEVREPWVIENVLPSLRKSQLEEVSSTQELRELFWNFWLKYKDSALCIVDCGYPVETGLFRKCVEDDLEKRAFLGPYPLHELSTLLYLKGIDPLLDRFSFVGYSDKLRHHPLHDAIVSGMCWNKALKL